MLRSVYSTLRNPNQRSKNKVEVKAWRNDAIQERITHSLVKGIDEFIDDDVEEARQNGKTY